MVRPARPRWLLAIPDSDQEEVRSTSRARACRPTLSALPRTPRRGGTNQEGEVNDVRFVKDGVARALRTLRAATSPEPADRVVPLSAQMIGLRFTAAAQAAGVERRVTAHSGRVGLASELTSRGASTTDVMLAGNWKTSRMVAHYSAGATAEPWRATFEETCAPCLSPAMWS